MKKQVFVVHGGETFDTYEEYVECLKGYKIGLEDIRNKKNRWKKNLGEDLGNDFEVILPQMPNEITPNMPSGKFGSKSSRRCSMKQLSSPAILWAEYFWPNIFPKMFFQKRSSRHS